MRPWQNAIALAATLLACGALLPLGVRARIACAVLAFVIIIVLLVIRLRAHAVRSNDARTAGIYGRIERIRAERAARRGRH